MDYHTLYTEDAIKSPGINISNIRDKIGWECPSNIALIKYWGKTAGQIPMNPSLSMSLSQAVTRTYVSFSVNQGNKDFGLEYTFNGSPQVEFEQRIRNYLNRIAIYLPFIHELDLTIQSDNTFPHSAGIASSASAFASLSLCLLDMEQVIFRHESTNADFLTKASFLARLGSGSAGRSVFGGYALWGQVDEIDKSSNETALEITGMADAIFRNLYDVILILDDQPKALSSSEGHALMTGNPFSSSRYAQAHDNLINLLTAMKGGDINRFIEIIEYEALSLHAMMMTSYPGYLLLKPSTLSVIEEIRSFRIGSGQPVGFTIDAGANVHVLFPADSYLDTLHFINNSLSGFCVHNQYIIDQIGSGPKRLPTI